MARTSIYLSTIDNEYFQVKCNNCHCRRKIALYDYDPTELSPNVDSKVELAFRTGQILVIFGDMDDDGFFMGELGGRRGLVPSNFLTDLPPGLEPGKHGGPRQQQQPRVLGQTRQFPPAPRWS